MTCRLVFFKCRFGESLGGSLLVAQIAWPNHWVLLVGAFCSTLGAALQCLTSKYGLATRLSCWKLKWNNKKRSHGSSIQKWCPVAGSQMWNIDTEMTSVWWFPIDEQRLIGVMFYEQVLRVYYTLLQGMTLFPFCDSSRGPRKQGSPSGLSYSHFS